MKKKILIVGGGGLGRELYSWVNMSNSQYDVVGFLDDNTSILDGFDYPVGVVSTIQDYQPDPGVFLVMGIMSPSAKKKVATILTVRGAEFMTFIHDSAVIGYNNKIGYGCVITPGCILTSDTELGDMVFLNTNSTIGHDAKVGAYSSINGKVELCGGVQLEDECLVGSHVLVIPGKRIGANAVLGAGSVVVGNVKAGTTVFGNPAKRI
ncbi:hypothetical protein B1L02_14460 [Pseudoalteromonas piscicida]|uniref:NeuD/PglB/VioB family sugar acetyltransferase n=1 Tax=Pseudoalteromonas piscicida TaxID=43662 RepID=UPI000B503733|nr:NeuD/PglB/VioB family sugar acetyltransferase [Pseudoalteromonas piscicida]ASD68092.1 hypothetical protein B1L02_14460 [Pseudoalteromonas piscicida]